MRRRYLVAATSALYHWAARPRRVTGRSTARDLGGARRSTRRDQRTQRLVVEPGDHRAYRRRRRRARLRPDERLPRRLQRRVDGHLHRGAQAPHGHRHLGGLQLRRPADHGRRRRQHDRRGHQGRGCHRPPGDRRPVRRPALGRAHLALGTAGQFVARAGRRPARCRAWPPWAPTASTGTRWCWCSPRC